MTDPRVAICFPSGDDVSAHFMLSTLSMLVRNTLGIATIANVNSSRIAFNRNTLVTLAKQANATHLLFMDADMLFPTDALSRLIGYDLDIVGATACRRQDGADEAIGRTLDGSRLCLSRPFPEMELLGCPFMLIKMDVFEKLREPWFAEPPRFMLEGEDPNDKGLMPEDEYFCWTAIRAGYDVICDVKLSLEIGHRGSKTFYIMQPQEE